MDHSPAQIRKPQAAVVYQHRERRETGKRMGRSTEKRSHTTYVLYYVTDARLLRGTNRETYACVPHTNTGCDGIQQSGRVRAIT